MYENSVAKCWLR